MRRSGQWSKRDVKINKFLRNMPMGIAGIWTDVSIIKGKEMLDGDNKLR